MNKHTTTTKKTTAKKTKAASTAPTTITAEERAAIKAEVLAEMGRTVKIDTATETKPSEPYCEPLSLLDDARAALDKMMACFVIVDGMHGDTCNTHEGTLPFHRGEFAAEAAVAVQHLDMLRDEIEKLEAGTHPMQKRAVTS